MKKGHGCAGSQLVHWLLVIGGLNWGLIGLFNFDLVEALFGSVPLIVQLIYILVGAAAIVAIVGCRCKVCKSGK